MSATARSRLEDSVSQHPSPTSSSYILSTSSLSLENGDIDVPFSAEYSVTCSQCLEQLGVSVLIITHCKGTLLDQG